MSPECRQAFEAEMASAVQLYRDGELARAVEHLEVAHVLGQQAVGPHVRTHAWMFRVGCKRRSLAQAWGQLLRIVLGALGSAVGIVPAGDTGGTNISMFKRLPIAPAIRHLVDR
jgi:hypothetical protein